MRIIIRFAALAFALTLLLGVLSCRGLDVVVTTVERDRLTTLRTFSIDRQADPALYIWYMRPIPFEELVPVVSDRLEELGYQPALAREADFRIVLSTFTEESTPRTRITVMEIFERSTSRKLWSGRAEFPYQIDAVHGLASDRTLSGLLNLVPAQAGFNSRASNSLKKL